MNRLRRRLLAAAAAPRPDGRQGTLLRRRWVERPLSFLLHLGHPVRRQQAVAPRPGDKAPRPLLDFDLHGARTPEGRVALSTVDEAGAQRSLDAASRLSFDDARQAAESAWNELLGRVRGPRVLQPPGGVHDSTPSLGDTLRASHPLFTLQVHERVPGFVNTMLTHTMLVDGGVLRLRRRRPRRYRRPVQRIGTAATLEHRLQALPWTVSTRPMRMHARQGAVAHEDWASRPLARLATAPPPGVGCRRALPRRSSPDEIIHRTPGASAGTPFGPDTMRTRKRT